MSYLYLNYIPRATYARLVGKSEPASGSHEMPKVTVRISRHSHKDDDKLSEEGIKYAQERGKKLYGRLPTDTEVEGTHSWTRRARQTIENKAKGGGLKRARIRTEDRLTELPKRVLDGLSKKLKDGRDAVINAVINGSGGTDKEAYRLSYNTAISYIKSEIINQMRHTPYGRHKIVDSVTHGPKIDSALVEILRRNGYDIKGIEEVGGSFNECDDFDVEAKAKGGKLEITVKYRGKTAKIEPKTLGITEEDMKRAGAKGADEESEESEEDGGKESEEEGGEGDEE